MLEPIFEADFEPCSYGFRPFRSAALRTRSPRSSISATPARNYEWVLEADIEACFDDDRRTRALSGPRCVDRDRRQTRHFGLVKAFLKAGVLTEGPAEQEPTLTGTPQGGILSPLPGQHRAVDRSTKHFARGLAER